MDTNLDVDLRVFPFTWISQNLFLSEPNAEDLLQLKSSRRYLYRGLNDVIIADELTDETGWNFYLFSTNTPVTRRRWWDAFYTIRLNFDRTV